MNKYQGLDDNQSLLQLFQHQVETTPNHAAIKTNEISLSYQELNALVNQLTGQIKQYLNTDVAKNSNPKGVVGIYLDKSIEMIAALLATINAGGVYVLMSVKDPQSRIEYIVNDTSADLILTSEQYINQLNQFSLHAPRVAIETMLCTENKDIEQDDTPSNIATIIYTSGTTGMPKGVLITQDNIRSLVTSEMVQVNKDDVFCFFASPAFDAATFEIWMPLLNGACLMIPSDEQTLFSQPELFKQYLETHRVSVLWLTKTLFDSLYVSDNSLFASLTYLIVGGEALNATLMTSLVNSADAPRHLLNGYGPTESTTFACTYEIKANTQYESIPIGKAIGNRDCMVFNKDMKPVKQGDIGELYLGGLGVAAGYLNRAEETEKVFIDGKLYKTGDLVRENTNGELEYIGRVDSQVKIRGYRIELAGIEKYLCDIVAVKQAAVILNETRVGKSLQAYIVCEDACTNEEDIKIELASYLPDYMIPAKITLVEAIPTNRNGKVDIETLRLLEKKYTTDYEPPRNKKESQLCDIWQQVLGIDKIGINDSFFHLGGNSILAIQLIAAIRKQMGLSLTIKSLYLNKTIKTLVFDSSSDEDDDIIHQVADRYPLSSSQKGQFFIHKMDKNNSAYHIPYLFELREGSDTEVLEQTCQSLLKKHRILKMSFRTDDNGVEYQTEIESHPICEIIQSNEQSLMKTVQKEIIAPFDLETATGFRVRILQCERKAYLLLVFHHIVFDGWSESLFFDDFNHFYQQYSQGLSPKINNDVIQYSDYASWQNYLTLEKSWDNELNYWKTQLKSTEPLQIPLDYTRPSIFDYQGENHRFELGASLSNQLRDLAKHHQTTLYTVLLAAYYITLSVMSGQEDIVIGSPSDNRTHEQTHSLVGYFINAIALRMNIDGHCAIQSFIDSVHDMVMEAKAHQALPFDKVLADLNIEHDSSRHPLFQTLFSLQRYAGKLNMDKNSPLVMSYQHLLESHFSPAQFDISLLIDDSDEQISARVNFATSLFNRSSIERLGKLYQRILQAFVRQEVKTIKDISLVSKADEKILLSDFNPLTLDKTSKPSIITRFQEQVQRHPKNTALIFNDETISYQELDKRSQQLAHAISQLYSEKFGVDLEKNTLIALQMDRSIELVIAILAILKLGAAYVPIAPSYPEARRQYILDDIEAKLIVTEKKFIQDLSETVAADVLLIEADCTTHYQAEVESFITQPIAGKDLAYVIYTSGTTGKPKGVLQTHYNVSRLFSATDTLYQFGPEDVWTLFHAYVFDFSVWELWGALFHGATLVIPSEAQTHDLTQFYQLCVDKKVSILNQTPAAFYQFANFAILQAQYQLSLRTVIFGGDALIVEELKGWFDYIAQHQQAVKLVNMYGITETTVHVTYKEIEPDKNLKGSIGKPLQDQLAYVLDKYHRLVPIGCPGELYVGGAGLAQGYLNRDALTQERFIHNPFIESEQISSSFTRLYKSGDGVRWLDNGELAYISRNDNQVKIRGYRIELGEIESVMSQFPGIKQVVVIEKHNNSGNFLAAFLVTEHDDFNQDHCREYLAEHLPEYMVPLTMTVLDDIPLTINGKLDKQALPTPEINDKQDYIAPTNTLEEQLCHVWQDIININRVGIEDNFFSIGGNSINAVQIVAKMKKQYQCHIPLETLFKYKTIAEIAKHHTNHEIRTLSHTKTNRYPLSLSQKRLHFIEQYSGGSDVYHIPYLITLNDEVRLTQLEAALAYVVKKHRVLQTVFKTEGTETVQFLSDKVPSIKQYTIQKDTLNDYIDKDIAKPFYLSNDLPLRLSCFKVDNKQHLLLIFHHIVFDGWSESLFFNELAEAYHAIINKLPLEQDANAIQFGDVAIWEEQHFDGKARKQCLQYWDKALVNVETLNLPLDKARPTTISYEGKNITLTLNQQRCQTLQQLAQKLEVSYFSLILSAFYLTLSKVANQNQVVMGVASEHRHDIETQSLIGFFVNTLPLSIDIAEHNKVSEFIANVHQQLTEAKSHQGLPLNDIIQQLKLPRDESRHPLFQVMCSMQEKSTLVENQYLAELTPQDIAPYERYTPAKCDLSLLLNKEDAATHCVFNYATALFNESTIIRIRDIFNGVLDAFVKHQDGMVNTLDVLPAKMKQQLLVDWNDTTKALPDNALAHELIAQHAESHADDIALVYQDESISYQTLNQNANQLAHYIKAHLPHPSEEQETNPIVALYCDSSINMLVGMVAILKAGAAYLPISPDFPEARSEHIINDSQTAMVLCDENNHAQIKHSLNHVKHDIMAVNIDRVDIFSAYPDSNPETQLSQDDLAYVIYTSGTTGHPKGVMVTHSNLLHLLYSDRSYHDGKKKTLWTTYTFDVSVYEIFSTLCFGAELHILNKTYQLDAQQYFDYLQDNAIEFCYMPPFFIRYFSQYVAHNDLPFLKRILTGVETIYKKDILPIINNNITIVNGYGPTETTAYSSAFLIDTNTDIPDILPIGKPMDNERCYILDAILNPVPIGTKGDLYISGAGVSRGYLNNADLTHEKFIDNPLATTADKDKGYDRLYKTGDIAYWREDGNIQYAGRIDYQVKINGFRIELGEIESAILRFKGIKKAVVIDCLHHQSKMLAAYVEASDKGFNQSELINFLKNCLPSYMIPASIMCLETLPLTHNGKINRHQLPKPQFNQDNHYIAPQSQDEMALADIWQAVLGLERVGIKDNFFSMGGDSIISIQLISAMRQQGYHYQVKDLFDNPSIASLLSMSKEATATTRIITETGPLSGTFNLHPIQQWFFKKPFNNPNHWNQSFVVKCQHQISQAQLRQLLQFLASEHDMLRCTFTKDEDGYHQCYHAELSQELAPIVNIKTQMLSKEALNDKLTQLQSDFDIENGPLWRAALLTGYDDDCPRIWFSFHHLIIDVVSWRILVDDMNHWFLHQSPQMKSSSYRQWQKAINDYVIQHADEATYWGDVLKDSDMTPISNQTLKSTMTLPAPLTQDLLKSSPQAYYTNINELLLSALALALYKVLGKETFHILMEGHGREAIDESLDVSRTVGWFTSLYPVKLNVEASLDKTIIGIKEHLRALPNKGIGFNAFLQQGKIQGNLPQISFNYLGQLDNQASQDMNVSLVDEPSGEAISSDNQDAFNLMINGYIYDGKMVFDIESKLGEEKHQILSEAMNQYLESIIMHTKEVAKSGGIKTPADYPYVNLSIKQLESLNKTYDIEEIYPASALQQGLLYHGLSHPKDNAYIVQNIIDYQDGLDDKAYIEAWRLASLQYPALRCAFNWDNDIIQIICKEIAMNDDAVRHIDLSKLTEAEQKRKISRMARQQRLSSFNFSQPGLFRISIVKKASERYQVILTMHHSIIDGWSFPILLDTVHGYYDALIKGQTPTVIEDQSYYHAQQHNHRIEESVNNYWQQALPADIEANDVNAMLSKTVDFDKNPTVNQPAEKHISIDALALKDINTQCKKMGVTLNAVLQLAWHKLIQIYTQDDCTIVGTTVSGRTIAIDNIEKSVGLYINTLPLKVEWDNELSIREMLNHIQAQMANINNYASFNTAALHQNGQSLFHSLFAFENFPIDSNDHAEGIASKAKIVSGLEKTHYPLSVTAFVEGEHLSIGLKYGLNALSHQKASTLLKQLKRLILQIVAKSSQKHHVLSCVSDKEKKCLLERFNNTDCPYPSDKSLHQLFEEQAERTPEHIAIELEGISLSYRELNQRANVLAHHLRQCYQDKTQVSIVPDTLVALYLERSIDMLIAMMAVLKAGCAYVPITPDYPDSRSEYILSDTQSPIIISHSQYQDTISKMTASFNHEPMMLSVDTLELTESNHSNPTMINTSRHLAYVIYTSGTTGRPKGVMIEHKSAVNLCNYIAKQHDLDESVKTLFCSKYVFDASIFEIFPALMSGCEIHIVPNAIRDNAFALSEYIKAHHISVAFIPTALLPLMDLNDAHMKLVHTGGDTLSQLNALPAAKTFNDYGPTEATVCVTQHLMQDENDTEIGQPIDNTRLYVLDKYTQLCPIGVPGELYIGGVALARGYLNQPELTQERFIDNPFANDNDKALGYTRLYKTGDIVSWRADGSLHYIGRSDNQVKIHGFRIELAEIEKALLSIDGLVQAVVIDVKQKNDKYLAAYIVLDDDNLNIAKVTELLSSLLPEYMIPASFNVVDAIPLTINGKVDKKSLPQPQFVSQSEYLAPRNSQEQAMCEVWQQILEVKRVGVNDNFFSLGGNSIKAIRLIALIRQNLHQEFTIKQLFEAKTVSQLLAKSQQADYELIPHHEATQYPLSFAQQRLLFIERFEKGTSAYHIPHLVELTANYDKDALTQAINTIANRHSILKTVYAVDTEGQNYQTVLGEDIVIQQHHVVDSELTQYLHELMATPFDLAHEMPIRLHQLDTAQKSYLLILIHHIAFDGWSESIFYAELAKAYQAAIKHTHVDLTPLSIQYGDYALWQHQQHQSDEVQKAKTFWQEHLKGYENLALPLDYHRPNELDYKGDEVHFELDKSLSLAIKDSAKRHQTTLYTVMLSAFYATLSFLTGNDDIIIGTPADNREHPQTQDLIGFFVNALPLRLNIDANTSIEKLIDVVHQNVMQAKSHQTLPFEQIVDLAGCNRDSARHPLFQVMFSLEEGHKDKTHDTLLPFKASTLIDDLYQVAKFDISLNIKASDNHITGSFNYATSLFKEASVTRFMTMYQRVISAFVSNESQSIHQIETLSKKEKAVLLHDFNNTDCPYPSDKSLHQLFEEQVERTPEHIAIELEGISLSYRELNQRANALAHHIHQCYQDKTQVSIVPDTLVALYLERSIDMLIAMMAVLKAGCAYVPITPDYPDSRSEYILSDTQSPIIISHSQYQDTISKMTASFNHEPMMLSVDTLELTESNHSNPTMINTSRHLAYVIYTSGTTGRPKGVMIEHKSAVNLCNYIAKQHDLDESVKTLFCSKYVFDASIFEIFPALMSGCEIHIVPNAIRDNAFALSEYIKAHHISVAFIPTALLPLMDLNDAHMKLVHTGGDTLSQLNALPAAKTFNDYGPTEATVCVTQHLMQDENDTEIGQPIDNTRLYVLDKYTQLCPIGVPGELYIGGVALARGYLNQPELTQERFIDNPFANDNDKALGYTRLYKTGDIVSWRADGSLHYIGRSDNQVKIHGFRIELAEIEKALLSIDGLVQAVVIDVKQKNDKYLAAYIVLDDDNLNIAKVTELLSSLLPEYMIPASFNVVDAIPLTINGKVDKKSLPQPQFVSQSEYLAPRNSQEQAMCEVWQQILEVKRVGVNDNFFSLGGNSIKAIRLIALIRQNLHQEFTIKQLFEAKTVSQLLAKSQQADYELIPHHEATQYPLSFAQQRLLFIERFEKGTSAYHIPHLVELTANYDKDALTQAINTIANRHSILKTVYAVDTEGQNYQTVLGEDIVIQQHHVVDSELTQYLHELMATPFDLAHEMPIRLHQLDTAQKSYLLILIHHIAFDGWSESIFYAELAKAYQAAIKHTHVDLTPLSIQYGDYALWQHQHSQSEQYQDAKSFWQESLKGYDNLALPLDYPRPDVIDYKGDEVHFELDKSLVKAIKGSAKRHQTTLYTVMLSAFYVTLSFLTGNDDIIIGTPSNNREHPQTQDLIGFFVNTLPLRLHIDAHTSIEKLIDAVHQNVMQAKSHQALPFEQMVDLACCDRDTARHPLFQAMFSLENGALANAIHTELPFKANTLMDTLSPMAKFDISLFIHATDKHITGSFNYATSLFKQKTVKRMMAMYQRILKAFVDNESHSISQLDPLSKEEKETLLHRFNETDCAYPSDKTLHQLFEEQVKRTPDDIALRFEDTHMTYGEFNARANQMAHQIKALYRDKTHQDFKANTLVALFMDRSLSMMVSIMAILKAGGAYVPISPEQGANRIQHILSDTATPIIISQAHYQETLNKAIESSESNATLLLCDKITEAYDYPTDNLVCINQPNDLAYVIYTSGTTGLPKGVMLNHNGVVNRLHWMQKHYPLNESDKVLQKTPYAFDVSVWELFWANQVGAEIIIAGPGDHKDPAKVHQLIQQHDISVIHFVPSMLSAYCEYLSLNHDTMSPSLKHVFSSGEALKKAHCQAFKAINHDAKLVNLYGPTEASIDVSVYDCDDLDKDIIPIGRPIDNIRLYILDKNQNLCPIGTPGELYISGIGVARGYLNKAELTKERFTPNPFVTEAERLMGYHTLYKTGDVVQYTETGNILHLGRNDFQVKIRGLRIELGEIESAIERIEGVKQALVIAKSKEAHSYLAAFIIKEDKALNQDDICQRLSDWLPEYMIPSSVNFITELPLTANGKLDTKALPETHFQGSHQTMAPRNHLEEQFIHIWQQFFKVDNLSINDDFFKVGGNSVMAIKLVYLMNECLNDNAMTLLALFKYKSIKAICDNHLQHQDDDSLIKVLSTAKDSQQQLFFVHPGAGGSECYVQLAQCLNERFNCYGIDNYNILHLEKESDIHQLATRYVDALLPKLTSPSIRLCGWSLGGQIALEMAYILEQRGYEDIELILLDTIMTDGTLAHLLKLQDTPQYYQFKRSMLLKEFDEAYVDRTMQALKAENDILSQAPTGRLKQTKVILFKAQRQGEYDYPGADKITSYIMTLKANNVENYTKDLKVIDIDCTHADIVNYLQTHEDYTEVIL